MKYDFDTIIDRTGTNCVKYDLRQSVFGRADVIPMWVADMDFPTADFIREAVVERAKDGVYGYTFREDDYLQCVAGWLYRHHGWKVEKEWISYTPGIVSAINMAVLALTKPGDEIIIQQPVYPPFIHAARDHGRVLVNNGLIETEAGFVMDYELLEKQATTARMLILSNPHNPVGRCWTKDELQRLGEICMRNNVLVISDEIHCDLVMLGHRHVPFASISEDFAMNSITCHAASKTFNLAGMATSSVIIKNGDLRSRFVSFVHSLEVDLGNIFGKIATMTAFAKGDEWHAQLIDYLSKNIDFAYDYIKHEIPGIGVRKPEATYLMWLDFSKFSLSDEELKRKMIFEAGLGLNDGWEFGDEGCSHMRMNLACPRSVISAALGRMKIVFG